MGFRYTGIRVRDLNRSIEFYTKVLGWLRESYRMMGMQERLKARPTNRKRPTGR